MEKAVACCEGDNIKIDDLPLELDELPNEKTGYEEQAGGHLPQGLVQNEEQMITNTFDKRNFSLKEMKKEAVDKVEKSVISKSNRTLDR